jgi:hypothetical protein
MMGRILGVIWDLICTITIFSFGFCLGSTYTLQEILSWGGFG